MANPVPAAADIFPKYEQLLGKLSGASIHLKGTIYTDTVIYEYGVIAAAQFNADATSGTQSTDNGVFNQDGTC